MGESAAKEGAEDPSMEDILASIRQILNDAEAPAAAEPPAPHHPAAPQPVPQDDIFVLEQSMLIEEPNKMAPENPVAENPVAENPPAAVPSRGVGAGQDSAASDSRADARPPHHDPDTVEPLLAPSAAAAASASMGALVRVMGQQQTEVYRGGPTLEDMVRDELRPLVKSWLDENLAPMVERLVRAEIARVTNGK